MRNLAFAATLLTSIFGQILAQTGLVGQLFQHRLEHVPAPAETAFQNAFRCQTIHLDPRRLFAKEALGLIGDRPVVVASPDPGGVKRAQLFRETLEASLRRPVGSAFLASRSGSFWL